MMHNDNAATTLPEMGRAIAPAFASTLLLRLRGGMPITVNMPPTGKTITLDDPMA